MRAKLIRINEPQNGIPWYYREYVYECIDCGKHYTRNSCNPNVSPYCGKCQRKYDTEKDCSRREKKLNDRINIVLADVRAEIQGIVPYKMTYLDKTKVLQIIDQHIKEVDG